MLLLNITATSTLMICYANRHMQLSLQCRLTFIQITHKHEVMMLRVNKNKAKNRLLCYLHRHVSPSILTNIFTVTSVSDVYSCFQFQIPRSIYLYLKSCYKNQTLGDTCVILQIFHPLFGEIWLLTLKHRIELLYLSQFFLDTGLDFPFPTPSVLYTFFSSLC